MSSFKERKTESRSIRMTKRVYDYVCGFDGDGFNDKFEKLVLTMQCEEQSIIERIDVRKIELESLCADISKKYDILNKLSTVERNVNNLLSIVERL